MSGHQQRAFSQLQGAQLRHTFGRIDTLLNEYQGVWRMQPMHAVAGAACGSPLQQLTSILCNALPAHPTLVRPLADALNELSLQDIETIDSDSDAQYDFFAPWLANAFLPELRALNGPDINAPERQRRQQQAFPFWVTNGIGGRKLAQIFAFIAHVPALSGGVVEWCAGKGHLGRLLSFPSQPQELHDGAETAPAMTITSLEWQPALCASGASLAEQFGVPQRFQQADVLSDAGHNALARHDHAIALHACGDLHTTLLKQATLVQLQSLWLAPCCYHLTAQSTYQPMSETAAESSLSLSRDVLKLAVQGQVTAGERVRQLRQTEVTWRLAYQLLREREAGTDHHAGEYRALPSVPKHWFSGRLEDFIGWACSQHGWAVPHHIDWQMLLRDAEQRYLLVKRLDVIRHVFRRPLELWLVLDRAMFLQQHHYDVSVGAFCDYQMTPRNLLISARLNDSKLPSQIQKSQA